MREWEEKVRQTVSKQESKQEHILKIRNKEGKLMPRGKLVRSYVQMLRSDFHF